MWWLLYDRREMCVLFFFFFQAEDGIRDHCVTGVQTCALPISSTFTITLVKTKDIHTCTTNIQMVFNARLT